MQDLTKSLKKFLVNINGLYLHNIKHKKRRTNCCESIQSEVIIIFLIFFLILSAGSKKIQNAMAQVSYKLTKVIFIERTQDVNKSNYIPIYTHNWKGKPVGHYNYEGIIKIEQLFYNNYSVDYLQSILE